MSSGSEFHSTGPAQEKDRRPYRSSLWRGTHNRALSVDLRARRGSYGAMSVDKLHAVWLLHNLTLDGKSCLPDDKNAAFV